MDFSVFEVLMLACFACSWPISIIKAVRTKTVIGKSPLFMSLLIFGYLMGTIHKILNNYDLVTYLYIFNMVLVSVDLALYYYYIGENRRRLGDR